MPHTTTLLGKPTPAGRGGPNFLWRSDKPGQDVVLLIRGKSLVTRWRRASARSRRPAHRRGSEPSSRRVGAPGFQHEPLQDPPDRPARITDPRIREANP